MDNLDNNLEKLKIEEGNFINYKILFLAFKIILSTLLPTKYSNGPHSAYDDTINRFVFNIS